MMTVKLGALEFEVTTGRGTTVALNVTQVVKGEKVSIHGFVDTPEAKTALKTILAFIS